MINDSCAGVSESDLAVGRPLNVVFIADLPVTGGATNSLVELTAALHDLYGVNCTVCTHQKSELNERLRAVGVSSVVTGHGPFLAGGSHSKLRTAYSVVANCYRWRKAINTSICKAEEAIDFSKVDLIHSNLPRTDLGILLAAKHGIPHICHLRESSFEDFNCVSLRKDPAKFISDNSAAMIAVSNYVKANWVSRGADPNKIRVIYNGVNVGGIRRKSAERKSGPLKVIFLGGYAKGKGIDDVLKAAAELPQAVAGRIQIDVYGYGNATFANAYVRRHGLEQFIRLHGVLENVKECLADYDIGLACSKAEAFGRIILEYKTAGLGVIAANRGAFPELIEDGVDGVLYDSNASGRRLSETLYAAAVGDLKFNLESTDVTQRTAADVAREVYPLYLQAVKA